MIRFGGIHSWNTLFPAYFCCYYNNSVERVSQTICRHTNFCCLFERCSHFSGETTSYSFIFSSQLFGCNLPLDSYPAFPEEIAIRIWLALIMTFCCWSPKNICWLLTLQQPQYTTLLFIGHQLSYRLCVWTLSVGHYSTSLCVLHHVLSMIFSSHALDIRFPRETNFICNYLWPKFWALHLPLSPSASMAFCAWQLRQLLRGNGGSMGESVLFYQEVGNWPDKGTKSSVNFVIHRDVTWYNMIQWQR